MKIGIDTHVPGLTMWTVRFYLPDGCHYRTVTLRAPSELAALARAGALDPDAAKGAGEVRVCESTWFDCATAFGRATADRIFAAEQGSAA